MGARAFFGGFLDGFTMAGIWKPRLTIPGAATRLFRAEPEDISWEESFERLKAMHLTVIRRAKELGLNDEQIKTLHALTLEHLRNAENTPERRVRPPQSKRHLA